MSKFNLQNDVLIRSLLREHVEYTPVWLMRQAGRYLPEYQSIRSKSKSFMNMIKTPEIACEITLQPINRYNLDAAIIFSDILTIPYAMNLGLTFIDNIGPKFSQSLLSEQDIYSLFVPDMHKLSYVFEAIKMVKNSLSNRIPLIGFAGSPWTVACYMIEGGSSKDYRKIKTMMYSRPDLLHHILKINTQATIDYLNCQIDSGVDVIMIFDSCGGIIPHSDYEVYSLNYIKEIFSKLNIYKDNQKIPTIVFIKNGIQWIKQIAISGCDSIGVDHTINLSSVRNYVNDSISIQGNIDNMVLFGSNSNIRKEVRKIIDDFGYVKSGGHVFNIGNGISQYTPIDSIYELIDEVHNYSRHFHN